MWSMCYRIFASRTLLARQRRLCATANRLRIGFRDGPKLIPQPGRFFIAFPLHRSAELRFELNDPRPHQRFG